MERRGSEGGCCVRSVCVFSPYLQSTPTRSDTSETREEGEGEERRVPYEGANKCNATKDGTSILGSTRVSDGAIRFK